MRIWIRIAVALALLTTAGIHVWLALPTQLLMFYVNAAGFATLAILSVYPVSLISRPRVIQLTVIWTSATIIFWLAIGERTLIAYLDKIVELAVLGLLWLEHKLDSR
ncbi:MAG: hypothetical protein FJ040_12430 [Chloroflexi bacterium]|nr:hypothetical protein [Chloroflexota bacterium]